MQQGSPRGWRYRRLVIVLACVVGATAVLGATIRGVGLSPDSLQYLSASESAVNGRGLTTFAWDGEPVPLTHYPPGYPLLVAAAARAGIASQVFARWSNVIVFGLTVTLVALIAHRLAPWSSWAAPAAACGCAISYDLVVVHSMAWSEPLYLTLTLGSLFALGTALERSSMRLLFVAGMAAGLAALVRYVGVANIAVVGLAVLLWWPASAWRRWRTAVVVSLLAAVPLLLTVALNAGSSGAGEGPTVANRQFAWHPVGLADASVAASVVTKWVTPLSDATYFSAVWLGALVALVALIVALRRRQGVPLVKHSASSTMLGRVLLLYAATYVLVLLLSMSLVDAQTEFEARLLVPLLAVFLVLGVAWLARQPPELGIVRFATGAIVALLLSANAMRLMPWLREARRDGLALRRIAPDAAPLLDAARQLPPSAKVYSNDPYFMRLHTGRLVAGIPRRRDPNSLLPNARHRQQARAICESATAQPTFLVLFDTPTSTDSTTDADVAAHSGDVALLPGGALIRVRPGCVSA